jgi:murein DD-endopeptidase MepM/ murein hydrolase activator NlpD
MTVRRERDERSRAWIAALALIAPLFLAGCATPHTHFEWTFADDPPDGAKSVEVKRIAAVQPRRDTVAVPKPRPAPVAYQQKPVHHPVEQASLPPASDHAEFAWPVRGRVMSEFGNGTGGERNDGINISAGEGTPIHAAADGIVSYAGDDLKSYGNLALIRHDSGYVTAYAHAQRFVVAKGDHVARGQVIGYVGQTGDVASAQLHFELRRGSRGEQPINPRPMLGPLQVASR